MLHCAAAIAHSLSYYCCAVDCAKHFSYVESSFPFHLLFISGLLCLDSVSFRSLERHCSLIWEISISCLGLIMISFPQWSSLCIPPPKTKKQQHTTAFLSGCCICLKILCHTKSWSYNMRIIQPKKRKQLYKSSQVSTKDWQSRSHWKAGVCDKFSEARTLHTTLLQESLHLLHLDSSLPNFQA